MTSYRRGPYVPTGRPVGRPKKPKPPKSLDLSSSLRLPGEKLWRGGNATFGENRKGYRGGRKPMYPVGVTTWSQAAVLSDEHFAIALYLGSGVFSRGVQLALAHARKAFGDSPMPETRVAAIEAIKLSRHSIARQVAQTLGLPVPKIPVSGSYRLSVSAKESARRRAAQAIATMRTTPSSMAHSDSELEEWER